MGPVTHPISQSQYQIQQDNGPKYLGSSTTPYLFKVANTCSWSLWLVYICFQSTVVTLNYSVFSHWQLYASMLAEIFITLPEMLFLLGTTLTIWKLPKNSEARKNYYLKGDTAPTVDVFITCAGEPTSVVIDTLKAVVVQDYPSTKFQVLLLDDGNSSELSHAVSKLSEEPIMKRRPAVQYISRPADVHKFGKARNLQYGIERTNSEFVASLDADMIVKSDWLRRMIPHVLADDAVGLANPPQVLGLKGRIASH